VPPVPSTGGGTRLRVVRGLSRGQATSETGQRPAGSFVSPCRGPICAAGKLARTTLSPANFPTLGRPDSGSDDGQTIPPLMAQLVGLAGPGGSEFPPSLRALLLHARQVPIKRTTDQAGLGLVDSSNYRAALFMAGCVTVRAFHLDQIARWPTILPLRSSD